MQTAGAARRWSGWALVAVLLLATARVAVALPERCSALPADRLGAAADEAVGWFARNQRADGTWRYRLDVDRGEDLGGYNWVRHAGVLLALEQADAAGFAAARPIADAATPVALEHLRPAAGGVALEDGGWLTTGGTALLAVALGERRLATGDPVHDDELRAMGRFLEAAVQADGSVLALARPQDGQLLAGEHSPFSTGQALFALARLERLFPGEGFGAPVPAIAGYLAHDRARVEGYVPDASDHWAAYGLAEVVRWPGGHLDADELAFARKQMGLLGIQVRYESQRTNGGIDRWVRGRTTSGAGLGTLGEGLARWGVVAAAEPALAGQRAWLRDRQACAAAVAVGRQTTAAEAASLPDPVAARGAFTQFGITQMDDQQHALSSILGALGAARDPVPLPRRTPVPASALLAALAALVACNPLRLGRTARLAARADGAGPTAATTAAAVLLMGAVAVGGGPALRALDTSAATALVAAGLAVVAGAVTTLLWPALGSAPCGGSRADRLVALGLAVARPEVLVLALAAGAGGQGWATIGGLLVAVAAGLAGAALRRAARPLPGGLGTWLVRLSAAAAVAAGVALVVDGVYAV